MSLPCVTVSVTDLETQQKEKVNQQFFTSGVGIPAVNSRL